MAEPFERQDRDLVLSPTQYAYVQDRTSGNIKVWVGPRADTLTANDRLVMWTGKRFVDAPDLDQARRSSATAAEGQYVVLTDPASEGEEIFPEEGSTQLATRLDVGKRIVIPGPRSFSLWPGQSAQVIDGHHLNLNQYLIAQVYEPDAARANMERQIAAPQQGDAEPDAEGKTKTKAVPKARRFTMGERIVIRGTDVSFYVPPTGIEVVPEGERGGSSTKQGAFVRDAVTLEQLEYCVLIDENGRKRYERGPAVVFPEPTETFVTEKNSRKFRAIELNEQSGLYIKVIAPYEEKNRQYAEGEELFLTGKDTPIYFPRPEQSVIHYGEQRKHHAVALPAGEGRYVLDRTNGKVDLVEGPQMLLPDPRTEVIVRRALDEKAVAMMYPGNTEAAQVNAKLRSERDQTGEEFLAVGVSAASLGESGSLARSYQATSQFAGDKMRRSREYTPPRTITLDTKYQGAVAISIWSGYAVLVMDKTGNRRVEVGPVNLLLKYDESLMALTLSTGRPKSDNNPLKTVYLRTVNNAVGDRILVETRDLVPVVMDLSLRVNFEGEDPMKWFDVEDYVALLTDHCRSRLRNAAKHFGIEEFYTNTIDIVRDTLLGESVEGARSGLPFGENGMRLSDVEVLGTAIQHSSVAELMTGSTIRAIQGAIQLSEAEEGALRDRRLAKLEREAISDGELTAQAQAEARLADLERDLEAQRRTMEVDDARRANHQADFDQDLGQEKQQNDVTIARSQEEVKLLIDRMKSVDPAVVTAIQNFGDQHFVEKLTDSLGPAAIAAGITQAELYANIFEGTPVADVMKTLGSRPLTRNGGSEKATAGRE